MKTNEVIDLILYGDIHEAPLTILGDHYQATMLYDDEQLTRLSIAATIKQLIKENQNVIY